MNQEIQALFEVDAMKVEIGLTINLLPMSSDFFVTYVPHPSVCEIISHRAWIVSADKSAPHSHSIK